jgi:hypothetical protein
MWLAVILVCLGPALTRELLRTIPYGPDGHAWASLDVAVDRQLCGAVSHLSGVFRLGATVNADQSLVDVPIRDVVESRGGREAYCARVTLPFVNNENSLMLLESAVLAAIPGASVRTIGQALWIMKMAMVAVFIVALLLAGAPVLLSGVLFAAALTIATSLDTHHFSQYPLVLPSVLLNAGVAAIAVRMQVGERLTAFAATCALGGVLSAFATNVRTSVAPLCAGLWVLYIVFNCARLRRDTRATPRRLLLAACVAITALWAGFAAFSAAYISPISSLSTNYNSPRHPIAHPLVLSLAFPRNALATSQGIEWNDELGLKLAQRVDPEVTYLGPRYEPALFRFYFDLWRQYPREMLGIYAAKFEVAGRALVQQLASIPNVPEFWAAVLFPLRRVTTGVAVLLLFAGTVGVAAWAAIRRRATIAVPIAMVGMLGLLTQLESALIVPSFVLQYHNVQLFALGAVCLIVYQLSLEHGIRAAFRHGPRTDAATAVTCAMLGAIAVLAFGVASTRPWTGRFVLDDVTAKTAIVIGGFVAAHFVAARHIVSRAIAIVLAFGSSIFLFGILATDDLAAAVATAAMIVAAGSAVRARTTVSSTIIPLAASGALAGLAVSFGGDAIVVGALLLVALIAATGAAGSRQRWRALAAAAGAACLVAWLGGATEFARAKTWMPAVESLGSPAVRVARNAAYRFDPHLADAFGDFALSSLSNGGAGTAMRARGFAEDAVGYRLLLQSAPAFPAALATRWIAFLRQNLTAVPNLLVRTIDNAAPARQLRGRLPLARAFSITALVVAPFVILVIACVDVRFGVWLLASWGYLIGIAPAQSEAGAIVGIVVAGSLTLAILAHGLARRRLTDWMKPARRALTAVAVLVIAVLPLRWVAKVVEARAVSQLDRTLSASPRVPVAVADERREGPSVRLALSDSAASPSAGAHVHREEWAAAVDFSMCDHGAVDAVLQYRILNWPGLTAHRVHVERGNTGDPRWLAFFPVYSMDAADAAAGAAGAVRLAAIDIDAAARPCWRGLYRVSGVDPTPVILQLQVPFEGQF